MRQFYFLRLAQDSIQKDVRTILKQGLNDAFACIEDLQFATSLSELKAALHRDRDRFIAARSALDQNCGRTFDQETPGLFLANGDSTNREYNVDVYQNSVWRFITDKLAPSATIPFSMLLPPAQTPSVSGHLALRWPSRLTAEASTDLASWQSATPSKETVEGAGFWRTRSVEFPIEPGRAAVLAGDIETDTLKFRGRSACLS